MLQFAATMLTLLLRRLHKTLRRINRPLANNIKLVNSRLFAAFNEHYSLPNFSLCARIACEFAACECCSNWQLEYDSKSAFQRMYNHVCCAFAESITSATELLDSRVGSKKHLYCLSLPFVRSFGSRATGQLYFSIFLSQRSCSLH